MKQIFEDEWLILEIPNIEHKKQAVAFILEMITRNQKPHGTGGLDSAESYEAWLKKWEKNRDLEFMGYNSEERVPNVTFFCVRKSDKKLIGMVNIRKHLTHKLDNCFVGNVGYSILPSEQKKGYGRRLMKLALKYCVQEYKLKTIRAGCYEYNIASKRIVESLGMTQIDKKGGIIKSLYYELNV